MKLIIVTGGRDFTDTEKVFDTLDKIATAKGDVFIIHGGASGADQRAEEWAKSRGMPCAEVAANWDYFGKRAGPTRNGWMLLLKPDAVVAFKGNAGTADMVRRATAVGIPVMEVW